MLSKPACRTAEDLTQFASMLYVVLVSTSVIARLALMQRTVIVYLRCTVPFLDIRNKLDLRKLSRDALQWCCVCVDAQCFSTVTPFVSVVSMNHEESLV